MATANTDICSVCTEDYNSRHRQSVSLPCGHDFCLSCLVRLRASGKHKCPTCRSNWAGVNLQTQFGMEALAVALQADQEEDEEDAGKKKMEADRCEKHSMPYDFWVNAKKEFYCRKCAAEEKSYVKLELIEDAIPQVKAALAADLPAAKQKVQNNLKSLDERHADLIQKKNRVREFMKAVQTLDDNFDQQIKKVVVSRASALDESVEIEKVEKKINKMKTPADLDVVRECKSILKKVDAYCSVPASDLLQTLLSDIACSYMKEEDTAASPTSRASFVTAIQRGGGAIQRGVGGAVPPGEHCYDGDQGRSSSNVRRNRSENKSKYSLKNWRAREIGETTVSSSEEMLFEGPAASSNERWCSRD